MENKDLERLQVIKKELDAIADKYYNEDAEKYNNLIDDLDTAIKVIRKAITSK